MKEQDNPLKYDKKGIHFEDPQLEIRFWKTLCLLLINGIRNGEFRTKQFKEDADALLAGLG